MCGRVGGDEMREGEWERASRDGGGGCGKAGDGGVTGAKAIRRAAGSGMAACLGEEEILLVINNKWPDRCGPGKEALGTEYG